MIYLYYGDDKFRRSLALDALKKQLIDPDWETINLKVLENPSVIDFSEAALSVPFGLGEKLVIINNPKFLVNKEEDEIVTEIMAVLNDLPERVSVVFNADKILGTIKLVKELKKISDTKEFKSFSDWDLKPAADWLLEIAVEKEIKIVRADVEFFIEYIGADSSKLFNELNRLGTLSNPVTKQLIEKESIAKADVFKYARSLASGDKKIAQIELKKIIRNDEAQMPFLIGLGTNINRYLKLKLLSKTNLSADEQAKKLGVSPGRLFYMKKEIQRMELSRLEDLSENLVEIERKVKQGKRSLELSLKLMTC